MRPERVQETPSSPAHKIEGHGRNEVRLILPATPTAVRRALGSLRAGLCAQDLDAEELGTIELVLAEVLNNVVEHAYENSGRGTIEVRVNTGDRGLYFTVQDEGKPMPENMPPLGSQVPQDCDIADLPEGGFGWFLIRELVKDLFYLRVDEVNKVTFRLAVGNLQNTV
ncbi:Blue-light-activated histidine kinase 2 [Aquimixticola soesokkakensis]|uniref:Blue-light-activated histidine kinase 2 n=1 Tax=Aquimixticola soesokkakensis TaxID=1519096 RepID=A0A1Y5TUF5_9RHOB|nr:ATP-binding protein [Aquimixticola soesokkakensis]SLN68468.1 Blue-light-activated histidine kinase 2 [Aquimixticola soesokkakensis]